MSQIIAHPSPWLTEKQAAAYLRLSRYTLARWRAEQRAPRHIRAGQRRIIYHIDDLDRWAHERAVEEAAAA